MKLIIYKNRITKRIDNVQMVSVAQLPELDAAITKFNNNDLLQMVEARELSELEEYLFGRGEVNISRYKDEVESIDAAVWELSGRITALLEGMEIERYYKEKDNSAIGN